MKLFEDDFEPTQSCGYGDIRLGIDGVIVYFCVDSSLQSKYGDEVFYHAYQ